MQIHITHAPKTTCHNDSEANETRLEFANNQLLLAVCGAFDRHLAYIETLTNSQIIHKGNQFVVIGSATARQQAAHILETGYQNAQEHLPFNENTIADLAHTIRNRTPQHSAHMFPALQQNALEQPPLPPPLALPAIARDSELAILTRRKTIYPQTRAQQSYVRALLTHRLCFGLGPAGTGKTYLAIAVAVSMFLKGDVEKIILSRPAIEAGERLGFLPGDMKDKVDPYMQPLYDALNDCLSPRQLTRFIDEKRIEIAPLAFMRGRSLINAFVVLDEAQNTTSGQMKMFLTRFGKGSRMVLTGDPSQIDLPSGVHSGLNHAVAVLASVSDVAFSHLSLHDSVRHPLVARILQAYDDFSASASASAPASKSP